LTLTEFLGFIAGVLTTLSLVPQIIRVFRLKSAREISTTFTSLLLAGMLIWLVYGIVGGLVPVMLWNAIGAALVGTLLYAKMRYGQSAT
jgi:MtN3 and saliva related transmembrane protein